jgi:hypothetical protein
MGCKHVISLFVDYGTKAFKFVLVVSQRILLDPYYVGLLSMTACFLKISKGNSVFSKIGIVNLCSIIMYTYSSTFHHIYNSFTVGYKKDTGPAYTQENEISQNHDYQEAAS